MVLKCILNTDETFVKFLKKLAKGLIYNSYINEELSKITKNRRNSTGSHILDTDPTHATEYDFKRV